MLTIDGSRGEGGGQVLRTSLALAMVTQRAVTLTNLRAGRSRPGLQKQHLTALHAAARICGAKVEGDAIGSQRVVFEPGSVAPGDYTFAIGSAGSATLVFQTVLPPLLQASGPTRLVLEGGTHNPLAPPADFLTRAYLPLVNRMGPRISARLIRHGFYPAGGGRLEVEIQPDENLQGYDLLARGEARPRVEALVSRLPLAIAERECRTVASFSGWPRECFAAREIGDSPGPGNAVLIELASDGVTELFTGFGEKSVSAEAVAEGVWREAEAYLAADVPLGPHLADQWLLPLALAVYHGRRGGVFRTQTPTLHTTTHIDLLREWLGTPIEVREEGPDQFRIQVGERLDAE